MKLRTALSIAMVLWATTAVAAPKIYSSEQLTNDKKRYTQRFSYLFEKGLWDVMTPDEKRALQGVVVRHPLRGAGPLTFKSVVLDGTPMVRAPVSSLKFLEDLSIAYAWRHMHRHSLWPIDEYLAILKHRAKDVFGKGQVPGPLSALGVPPRIWELDKQVDELSLRLRNTAWAAILAHELGHLRFGHNKANASPQEILRQEEAADKFAVDLLKRTNTVPMGWFLWLQATAGYTKNRSDFQTEAAYLTWLRSEASHPVNGSRIRKLASHMQRHGGDWTTFSAMFLPVGKTIEDPNMQQLLKRCASVRRAEDLKRLDDGSCQSGLQ